VTARRCRAVVLVGPRGAGKSTVAPLLAAELGFRAVDTDDLLAAAVGRSAGDHLAAVGESAFRQTEQAIVVAELAAANDAVVALGGGAVLSAAVRAALQRDDLFVAFLNAAVPVLADRIRRGGGRPSLTGRAADEEVGEVLALRLPLYREVADVEVDTGAVPAAATVATLARSLRMRP
jgi:shikimate kinase